MPETFKMPETLLCNLLHSGRSNLQQVVRPRISSIRDAYRLFSLLSRIALHFLESSSMNIAIVGSGITGLAAGWMLAKAGHQVSLFEKHDHLGMDAHSVTLPEPFRSEVPTTLDSCRIDVPPRLFNRQLWPHVFQLYQQAGVETCPIDPTKTFFDSIGDTYLNRLHGYRPALKDLLRIEVRSIVSDANRLLTDARRWQQNSTWPDQELSEFWSQQVYSADFIYRFLYPALSSTVCTCDFQTLDRYPVEIIFSALLCMVDGDPLQRTRWGSQDVVARLARPVEHIQLGANVEDAELDSDNTQVLMHVNSGVRSFDHLIVATQANHVASIVKKLTVDEQLLLQSFRYVAAPVVVHTDSEMMPAHAKHWSHFNMQTNHRSEAEPTAAQCTMWMNRFRDDWKQQPNLFQTILPYRQPSTNLIIARGNLQRPAVTRQSFQLWKEWERLMNQPNRRIWFCGSYAKKGVPLLESGVASAKQIVDRINCQDRCF